MLVQKSAIRALGGCAGTAEYYRSTRESVAGGYYRHTREALSVQQSTIGALGRLCVYSRVLKEHPGGCVGRQSNIKAL